MTRGAPGFFDVDERLAELSAKGDDLERAERACRFRAVPTGVGSGGSARADRSKGGRPPFDHVLMFKVLILQAMHSLSDERCEYLIKDRLSFMRFLGLGLADAVPDANTIWTFREALKKAERHRRLVRAFRRDAARDAGFLAMSGQIVDATIVAAPKQRNTIEEKKAIKDRPHSRGLEGQAEEARAEGPGRALDGEIHQGQAARGRLAAAGRSRHSGVRLQEPRLDRSRFRADPQMDGDRRRRA